MSDILGGNSLHIATNAILASRVRVPMDRCRSGMRVAKTIFNNCGAIIINENTVLDDSMIKILKKIGIEEITVFEQYDSYITVNPSEAFEANYKRNLNAIRHVFADLYSGKPISVEDINSISDSIYEAGGNVGELIKSVNNTREADEYIYTHSLNVSMMSMLIARWADYGNEEVRMLIKSGLLHDIGKVKVDKIILEKSGRLSIGEYLQAKQHSRYGYEMIVGKPGVTDDICMGVLMHHERENGSGYPLQLKGDRIHGFAKIIAVADVFDAMSSNRTYRKGQSPFSIFDQFETGVINNLDSVAISVFLKHAPTFYIGDKFFLDNGEVGEVVSINPNRVARPLIRVGDRYIDLSKDDTIKLGQMI